MPAGAHETNPRGGVMFEALGSRVRSRPIPAVCLRAALVQMAPLCLILQVVVFQQSLVVAQEDISSRVHALIEALKDTEWSVCDRAAHALGRIGPEAKAAVPALSEALKDEYGLVRKATDVALRKITEGQSGDRKDDAGAPGPGESDPER